LCNTQLPVSIPHEGGVLVWKNKGAAAAGQADVDALVISPLIGGNLKDFWNLKTLAYPLWLDGFSVEAQLYFKTVALGWTAVNRERYRNRPLRLAVGQRA